MKAQQSESTWRHKLSWFALVIVVPFLSAAILLAIALQIFGVPVWKTTAGYLGLSQQRLGAINSPLAQAQSALAVEKTKTHDLVQQNQALQAKIKTLESQSAQLQSQVKQLQGQLTIRQSTNQQAKQEASVLGGMDPSAAAQLLGNFSQAEAGQVIAAMQKDAASQVLAHMKPTVAAKILGLAAQDVVAAQVSAANSTP